jgi:hypothetical protein
VPAGYRVRSIVSPHGVHRNVQCPAYCCLGDHQQHIRDMYPSHADMLGSRTVMPPPAVPQLAPSCTMYMQMLKCWAPPVESSLPAARSCAPGMLPLCLLHRCAPDAGADHTSARLTIAAQQARHTANTLLVNIRTCLHHQSTGGHLQALRWGVQCVIPVDCMTAHLDVGMLRCACCKSS